MTGVDLILLGLVALMAVGGFRRGLIVGLCSLGGLVAGAYVGARVAPELGGDSRYVPLFTLAGAMAAAAIGQSLAVLAGRALRPFLAFGPLRALDSVGGGALGAAVGLVLCWVVGAVFLYLPGQVELRHYAQESAILSALNDEFPPERLMDALSRVDPFAALAGPQANVDPPRAAIVVDPEVQAARPSVVRVTGYACGLGVEGSGWIAAPTLVVTNAHVVAGVSALRVDRGDGRYLDGTLVSFDRKNDVAVMRVPGLEGRPLPLADEAAGADVALLGFPGNGPFAAAPARLGATVRTVGRDAYGSFPVARTVTTIRGVIRSGNSGGPAVDAAGRVRSVVFAQRAGSEGGYGVPIGAVRDALAAVGDTAVETPCVDR